MKVLYVLCLHAGEGGEEILHGQWDVCRRQQLRAARAAEWMESDLRGVLGCSVRHCH